MPRDQLFRQEALEARSTQWLGAIRVAQPIGDRVAAAVAIAIVVAIVAFATVGTYTRRATVTGLLEPVGGALRLTSPSGGTVAAMALVEGQEVAAGDVLFVVSGERRSDGGPTLAAIDGQLGARHASLIGDLERSRARHASRLHVLQERLAAIDIEVERLRREVDIHAARRRIAEANAARFEALATQGFVAPMLAQARVDEALVVEAQEAASRRSAAALSRERSGLVAQRDDSRLQADGEAADIRRALAMLGQERAENAARRSQVVVAPHAGVVTGIVVHAGQSIAAGALLATLVPAGIPLEAHLYASTRQAGFVARGQRVHLRYAAYPYQKFGMGEGTVDSVARSAYALQELPTHVTATLGTSMLQGNEPVYRIVVRLDAQTIATDGRTQALRSGMVFDADVVQDRRRLYEWLLEPIQGLAGRG